VTEPRDERDRVRFELYEWRARALEAEPAKAELEALRARRSWRLYTSVLRLGARALRRLRKAEARDVQPPPRTPGRTDSPKTVLFVSGLSGDTLRYRCDHPGEAFAFADPRVTFDVALEANLDLGAVLDHYEFFVLHRVLWSTSVERFVAAAREQGKPVLFDVDDLVFDPDVARFVALERLTEPDRIRFLDGLHRCRRTMEECDGVLVSTDALAAHAREVNLRVAVTPNVVSGEMVALAHAVSSRRANDDSVSISYFSGTPTHDRDLLEAVEAVLWALEEYPQVRFRAVGRIELDERFDRFGSRVERVPHQPWRRLPELLATTAINLAPLERDNPFTECKSCVKYLEAGLLGVPTIASPRNDFSRVIEHDVNGFLADDAASWRQAIQTLVEAAERRRAMGRAAYEDVRANHTTAARSQDVVQALVQLAPNLPESPVVPTAT
jgi:glycosyltransferase involved in cell wall biosynthesis